MQLHVPHNPETFQRVFIPKHPAFPDQIESILTDPRPECNVLPDPCDSGLVLHLDDIRRPTFCCSCGLLLNVLAGDVHPSGRLIIITREQASGKDMPVQPFNDREAGLKSEHTHECEKTQQRLLHACRCRCNPLSEGSSHSCRKTAGTEQEHLTDRSFRCGCTYQIAPAVLD